MKIAIVGTGYVGLVSGTCFAEIGVNVTCVDTNKEKIESLQKGNIPIYENGLEEMVLRNMKAKRLKFTTSLESCLDEVEVIFSAVGTPPDEDGSADLKYVLEVARTIGRNMKQYKLVVTKSTVPVGTASKVRAVIQEELDKRGVTVDFDVASNPEFLKEGNAIRYCRKRAAERPVRRCGTRIRPSRPRPAISCSRSSGPVCRHTRRAGTVASAFRTRRPAHRYPAE